eukprot:TRINITY_DN10263_c0_g1_i1.p1 TRINITY_DN10263_c0_g1~~TRINITY_DN10263_c0_g1_i1.p1  ORF type:complete len:251 (+),score=58.21 TRINITY_DN10263_c0_g1_i1:19-771(+)
MKKGSKNIPNKEIDEKKGKNNTKENNFYKFPKTPHLEGSSVVDDDEIINFSNLKLDNEFSIVIQEKVDGANVSMHFLNEDNKYNPIIQKRSGLIEQKGEHEQYEQFRKWVMSNIEELWEILGDEYVIFGEWLYCLHAVKYDQLPDFFLAFDLLNKKTQKWKSFQFLKDKLNDKFTHVPLLWSGSCASNQLKDKLKDLILPSKFSSNEISEGVYIRIEKGDDVVDRFKLRRKTFVSGRTDFSRIIIKNQLK